MTPKPFLALVVERAIALGGWGQQVIPLFERGSPLSGEAKQCADNHLIGPAVAHDENRT